MKPEDVKAYYGSQYMFRKKTGMSANTLGNWLKWGYVPEDAQYKLERITNGELKIENFDLVKARVEIANKRNEKNKAIQKSFTPEQVDFICYQIGEWYLDWKGNILVQGYPEQHRLGIAKEQLKNKLCGD